MTTTEAAAAAVAARTSTEMFQSRTQIQREFENPTVTVYFLTNSNIITLLLIHAEVV